MRRKPHARLIVDTYGSAVFHIKIACCVCGAGFLAAATPPIPTAKAQRDKDITDNTPIILLFFIFCTLLFLYFLVQRVWKSLKDKRFEKFFVLFLDQVILFVQCGDSFRSAFKSSIKFVPELFHQELQEMYERVTFSQQIPHFSHSQLKKHLLSKLISIDKGKENPLSALKNLRTELHLASLFRHKSMQITASARFQCGILCFLYLSLLFFVLSRFSWVQNRSIISLSILIFCTSLIVFYFLGRKSEWKV